MSSAIGDAILQLRNEAVELRKKATAIDEVVERLKKLCRHEMEDNGSDQGGKQHVKCVHCGHEEAVA